MYIVKYCTTNVGLDTGQSWCVCDICSCWGIVQCTPIKPVTTVLCSVAIPHHQYHSLVNSHLL